MVNQGAALAGETGKARKKEEGDVVQVKSHRPGGHQGAVAGARMFPSRRGKRPGMASGGRTHIT